MKSPVRLALAAVAIAATVALTALLLTEKSAPQPSSGHVSSEAAQFRDLPQSCLPGADAALQQEFGPLFDMRYNEANGDLSKTRSHLGARGATCTVDFGWETPDITVHPARQPVRRSVLVDYQLTDADMENPVGRAQDLYDSSVGSHPNTQLVSNVGDQAVQTTEAMSFPGDSANYGHTILRISNLVVAIRISGENGNGRPVALDGSGLNTESISAQQALDHVARVSKAVADALQTDSKM